MDEIINRKIRELETQTKQWRFSDLSEQLYIWFDLFNENFFQGRLKNPVISFERTRSDTLGHFALDRNAFGLKWNTNINCLYVDLPLVDTLATLLHEMTHQWQQEFGKKGTKRRTSSYHNVEFRDMTKSMGIPSNESGATLSYQNPFLLLLKNHGVDIYQKSFSEEMPVISKRPGKSKLKKWHCGCTNVRVAISDFQAQCLKCGNRFILDT